MRVVLGGEKAAIAMQDIRRTRIFIVITPLLFFEVTVTIMFVRGEQILVEQGQGWLECQRSRRAVSKVMSERRCRSQIATRTLTYVHVRTKR